MGKVDFKSLTPDEVDKLEGKQKDNYNKWLANQDQGAPPDAEEKPEPEEELVYVVAKVHQVNTSKYGNIVANGKPKQISKALAEQLAMAGEVDIVPIPENEL